jgi:endonuclease/exonuclease/phosphatase family metal-dependent hydrolase
MLESGEEVLSAGFFVRRITQHTTLSPVEGGPPLLFLNTHLSCGRHRRGSERRLSQARTTLEHVHHQELRHRPQATILVGDLNAPPASPEVELLAGGLLDTYRAAGPPQDPGWTLDPRNPLCRSWGSGWGETGRIDYVFLRPGQSPGPSLHVDSSQVVLREPDPASGLPLSDHYGVLSVLRWE